MNIYLSYHPIKLHSISLPIILTHDTISLQIKYFDEFNIIDVPQKYNKFIKILLLNNMIISF